MRKTERSVMKYIVLLLSCFVLSLIFAFSDQAASVVKAASVTNVEFDAPTEMVKGEQYTIAVHFTFDTAVYSGFTVSFTGVPDVPELGTFMPNYDWSWIDDTHPTYSTNITLPVNTTLTGLTITPRYDGQDLDPLTIPIVDPSPTTYNITVNKSGGGENSTASASATSAAAGANITLNATAAANYHFVNWTATGVNISNATSATEASFTMPSNAVTVTANFSQNSSTDHTITVTTDGHGTAQATPTSASNDAVITLSATPSSGYEFDRWTSTTNGIHFADYKSRNTTFNMVDENVTVKANFKAKSNPKKDDDDDDHHEESSSPSPEKPSWTPAKAAATIAAQKAQKQQAAATQLASIQTMLRTKTSDRAGTGRNVIDLDMTKVDILDPATVNLLLLNNRFAFNVKISVPGGLTTTIMIPANFNFRPFIKADGTMNIHEVLWWIISKKK